MRTPSAFAAYMSASPAFPADGIGAPAMGAEFFDGDDGNFSGYSSIMWSTRAYRIYYTYLFFANINVPGIVRLIATKIGIRVPEIGKKVSWFVFIDYQRGL